MKGPFPLSKTCDLTADAPALAPYYQVIDAVPDALNGQHPIRRWEYAMALLAIDVWPNADSPQVRVADIGGAGSNFWKVLFLGTSDTPITLIDPDGPDDPFIGGPVLYYRESVETYAATAAHGVFDILTCISVIEHVKDLRPFFRACHMLLKPGGLLVLTTDFWDRDGEPDTAHFHWMRRRIYTPRAIQNLLHTLTDLGYTRFGVADWTYHGAQVYDYSIASLVAVKR